MDVHHPRRNTYVFRPEAGAGTPPPPAAPPPHSWWSIGNRKQEARCHFGRPSRWWAAPPRSDRRIGFRGSSRGPRVGRRGCPSGARVPPGFPVVERDRRQDDAEQDASGHWQHPGSYDSSPTAGACPSGRWPGDGAIGSRRCAITAAAGFPSHHRNRQRGAARPADRGGTIQGAALVRVTPAASGPDARGEGRTALLLDAGHRRDVRDGGGGPEVAALGPAAVGTPRVLGGAGHRAAAPITARLLPCGITRRP